MCGIALVLETLPWSPAAVAATAGSGDQHSTQCSSSTNATSAARSALMVARFGAAFEQELLAKLHHRGPDLVSKRPVPLRSSSNAASGGGNDRLLDMYAAVLHLRGDALFPQPVVDASGNVLCWNGEVFGGEGGAWLSAIGEHENDTKLLSNDLWRASQAESDTEAAPPSTQQQRILAVLQEVHGPFAFTWFHRASQRVYFGHDRFGRRSLLYHCASATGDKRDLLTDLAEQEDDGAAGRAVSLTRDELARLCLSSVAIAGKDASGQHVRFEEVPSNGIFALDLSDDAAFQLEFHPHPALVTRSSIEDPTAANSGFLIPKDVYDCGLPLISPTSSSPSLLEQAANGLLVSLSNAVGVRVRTIPRPPQPQPPATESQIQARVGILFSGGLDSVVLGALAHFHAPLSEPIDLLNVCFDASSGFHSPDRLAAEISVAELQTLFPERQWRFVRVNVPFEAVLEQQRAIYELMTPCDTHMDFNIGAAFWFLARAQGDVSLTPEISSGLGLKDLNAFLSNGSRTAEAQSLETAIQALGLFPESEDDKAAVECPVATCKRKKKPGCAFGICRVCCFRMQKSVNKLLDDATHAGEKAKCVQNLSAMGISDDDNGGQLEKLLHVLSRQQRSAHSQPFALDCRVHRAKTASEPDTPSATSQSIDTATASEPGASQPYTSTARVLLVGIGADEQLGGYGRHRTAFVNGGAQALRDELAMDMRRIWKRNLGRDDRCISSHGKEARFPFLDERVVQFVSQLPTECICDFSQERGEGDKLVLRLAARQLGLRNCTGLAKRAIQFGTRIAKHSNALAFGSNRQATGGAKFQLN
ncbi:Vacuolar protein sorting-associated protein 33a [Globisporangium polare]